jgi:hypothetical protein
MAKHLVYTSVYWLNQPFVKEGVKNTVGIVTFTFGLVEIYDGAYHVLRGRAISTENSPTDRRWKQVSHKIVMLCAKFSLILSAATSRPGVMMISALVGRLLSPSQLNRLFGPNTILAVNPWHPRHVASIAAVLFALPSVAQSTYQGVNWTYRKIRHCPSQPVNSQANAWLTDSKIRRMTLFNTFTSRPVLHIGNQLARYILSRL